MQGIEKPNNQINGFEIMLLYKAILLNKYCVILKFYVEH